MRGTGDDLPEDTLTRQLLIPELMVAARKLELKYFESKHVWDKTPHENVKWVNVNKRDDDNPTCRNTLMAREIRFTGRDGIFAPTNPLRR